MDPDIPTLESFLRTGKLKEITLGMDIDDMVNYLGLPDGIHENDTKENFYNWYTNFIQGKHPSLPYVFIYYGNLVLTLVEYKVWGIRIYAREQDPHTLPSVLEIDWLETVYQMTSETFRQYVHTHQIFCERILYPELGDDNSLFLHIMISSSGSVVVIDLEDGSDSIFCIDMDSRPRDFPTEPW